MSEAPSSCVCVRRPVNPSWDPDVPPPPCCPIGSRAGTKAGRQGREDRGLGGGLLHPQFANSARAASRQASPPARVTKPIYHRGCWHTWGLAGLEGQLIGTRLDRRGEKVAKPQQLLPDNRAELMGLVLCGVSQPHAGRAV